MLSYQQALKKIMKYSRPLKPRKLPLGECLGLVLAEDIFAPEPLPGFDNSAVDGYAVASCSKKFFKVRGEIRAGDFPERRLKPGEAVQIFTGAPVPKGAYAVAMQENTERVNGSVRLLKKPDFKNNVRFRGEDFPRGKRLLKQGTLLQPAHLALLAAIGRVKVPVIPLPEVSVFATGNELLKPGQRSAPGKIRDSNTVLLEALVRKAGGTARILHSVSDDPRKIRRALRLGLKSDILVVSGGVSVGKYDFVKEVLKKEGVREIFWKVNIKPGKPLFFGKRGRTLVFGLPGNPVSVFVTFEEFVRPAIFRMKALKIKERLMEATLKKSFRNGNRMNFVRVICSPGREGHSVTPLKGQGSHQVGALARANAILPVPPGAVLKANQKVFVKQLGE